MKNLKVAAAGLTGTTVMTLFSEAVSQIDDCKYNEAEILGQLLNRITPLPRRQAVAAGWVAHYLTGLAFAAAYKAWLKKQGKKPTALNGIVFGGLSGLAGVGIWHSVFKAHPNPPGVRLKTYYIQLVFAHMVFGLAAAAVLRK